MMESQNMITKTVHMIMTINMIINTTTNTIMAKITNTITSQDKNVAMIIKKSVIM
jgi:hypothetical protein